MGCSKNIQPLLVLVDIKVISGKFYGSTVMANEGTFGNYVNTTLKPEYKGSDEPLGQHVSQAAHERNELRKTEKVEGVAEIPEAPADVQQNKAILEASFEAPYCSLVALDLHDASFDSSSSLARHQDPGSHALMTSVP